jgi:ceramide glucosyltransferase
MDGARGQGHPRNDDDLASIPHSTQGMNFLDALRMHGPDAILHTALKMVGVAGYIYALAAMLLLRAWRRTAPARAAAAAEFPPITLLRPLKAGVPALREKLEAFARAMRPGDQFVLGADEGSDEMNVCAELRAAFPEREIVVVPCQAGAALNPKISKLVQMAPQARHAHWVLSDSEAMIDAAWLSSFREEWAASGAEVLTAGYRFVNLATWPQRLDAAATLLGLWPGLAFLRRTKQIHFTLGACTGFHRSDIEALGGWAAFGEFLAEDNRLGAALAKAGRTIRLSAQVATLDSDPLTWRDYWRHQRRVAVTYRVCNPAGFAGMIAMNGVVATTALALVAALEPKSIPIIRPLLFIVMIQLARCAFFRGAGNVLRFPIPWLFPVMLAADAAELACWCAAWFDRRVWWAGRRWRVSREGRLTPIS